MLSLLPVNLKFSIALCMLLLTMEPIVGQQTLEQLKDRQRKIKQVISDVSPCVVAIDGGCGVVVSDRGHVLTVSHVPGEVGRRVQARFADGTIAMGVTLGSHPTLDVATVKLAETRKWPSLEVPELSIRHTPTKQFVEPSSRLPTVKLPKQQLSTKRQVEPNRAAAAFGDKPQSSQLPRLPQLDSWCLAFGYPLSFPRGKPAVVRLGQVTSIQEQKIIASAIIMGGDSGGPLVDLDGRLLGISSRVKASVESNIYIPIQVYAEHWSQLSGSASGAESGAGLTANQVVRKAWFGILGDTDQSRVRVRRVQFGSPAAEAGLRPEDVIVKFGDRDVTSFSEIVTALRTLRPGDRVSVRVNRYGKMVELSAVLGEK